MRTRRIAIAGTCLSLAIMVVGGLVANRPAAGNPAVTLRPTRYFTNGSGIGVGIVLSNASNVSVGFTSNDGGPSFRGKAETPNGWMDLHGSYNYTNGYCPLYETGTVFPGSNCEFTVCLPPHALRWQIEFMIHSASSSERVTQREKDGWRLDRLNLLVHVSQSFLRFAPDRRGRNIEVKSPVFDVPPISPPKASSHNKRHGAGAGWPLLSASGRHVPSATRAERSAA
jgi:hypothetical protein